ncbi:pyridoxal kinase [Chrysoperla carnea]|uniref:pyridoxal kinase n=1 Tax=Chrysoperla carnea TaxID=189513 RepID=UPI001D05D379|nr:pyridoxal kinase [Chrysoperla carnea]
MATSPRVLSIQSHVVSGYVGNKAATFPLQVLGFEVDPLNSVQFSNHTGYGSWKGQVLNEKDLDDLSEGLDKNKLNFYTHLLTGYVGSPSFLRRIAEEVKKLKTINPNLIYVCDPVMGDNGEMYVPKELLPIYRDEIISLADILTPNQYEAELLTGIKIKSINDAWKAIDEFHVKGVKTVAISSTNLGTDEYFLGLCSSVIYGKPTKVTIKIKKLPANFTGTGDVFAALFLAWMYKTENNLKVTLENTIATLQGVLRNTLQMNTDKTIKSLELRLISSKNVIENPTVEILGEIA